MSQLQDIVNTPLVRKRPREDSSPNYDFSPIGIDQLEALADIEAKFTQASPLSKKRKRSPTPESNRPIASSPLKLVPAAKPPLPENAVPSKTSISRPIPNASALPKSNSTKLGRAGSISDEFDDDFDALPDENDYDTWFQPAQEAPPTFVSFVRPSLNPSKGNTKIIQPSEAAMQAAKKLFAEVEKEEEKERLKQQLGESTAPTLTNKPTKPLESSQSSKQAAAPAPASTAATRIATTSAVQSTPIPSKPRITNLPNTVTPRRDFQYHPSHPASKQPPQRAESPSVTPATAFTTPLRNKVQAQVPLSTPQPTKRLGMRAHARGPRKSKFETPWKQGPTVDATPGPSTSKSVPSTSTSHLKQITPPKLHSSNPFKVAEQSPQITKPKRKSLLPYSVFDINPPPNRQQLMDLSPPPKRRQMKELEAMGIPSAVGEVDTWNALYWAFEKDGIRLDVNTAFEEMKKAKCTLVDKAWVENHWVLIVWKLANMVCTWPSTQGDRWSFQEVIKQLLYRYEREINRCERPAIRLIQERDASPGSAMILCVFDITWPDNGKDVNALPEFVLTDGWYKIRAKVDQALARAARKGRIRIGAKLSIMGAKLDAQRKDAEEVLKSFDSSSIVISGNGTHLAPWHSKLGFQQRPFIATLNSLSPDGGVIPLMSATIQNAFPLAFLETFEDKHKERETRDEEEEMAERNKWQKQRADKEGQLREEICKELEKLEGLTERLQAIAGDKMPKVSEDSPPDEAEDLAEALEEAEDPKLLLKGVKPTVAGWAAISLREKYLKRRDAMGMEIESELASSFPPRDVRSFRVLVVKDVHTAKKPCMRTAQITVWDAEELGESLKEGKQYMVMNLLPKMLNAWGKPGVEGQVFLSTRKDTRWTRIIGEKK